MKLHGSSLELRVYVGASVSKAAAQKGAPIHVKFMSKTHGVNLFWIRYITFCGWTCLWKRSALCQRLLTCSRSHYADNARWPCARPWGSPKMPVQLYLAWQAFRKVFWPQHLQARFARDWAVSKKVESPTAAQA